MKHDKNRKFENWFISDKIRNRTSTPNSHMMEVAALAMEDNIVQLKKQGDAKLLCLECYESSSALSIGKWSEVELFIMNTMQDFEGKEGLF